ncbi:MAG TPA: GH25 family lysozyme, partial [Flavisolibacter sp.]|nr:GH25 family lysozyme [Flavisolibacter sp.]
MLNGIDVSHFSELTLPELKDIVSTKKLYFNFIKASEGATLQDSKFVNYWQMSRMAGLVCGAYHFFRPLVDPAVQAANFVTLYKDVSRIGVLPPVVDLEWSPVGKPPSEQWLELLPNRRVPALRTYLSAIETALNVRPIIYTAIGFWKEFIEAQSSTADNTFFSHYTLWVVDLKKNGKVPTPWTGITAPFVQYHFG